MKKFLMLCAVCLALPGAALAADDMLKSEPHITLPLAKLMAQACEDLAAREGYAPVAIAIIDQHINLKLFVRQDGVPAGSVEFAQLKARSAAALGIGTLGLRGHEYSDAEKPMGLTGVDGFTIVPGGKSVTLEDGTRLGGVGVSGAAAEEDEHCAQAAVEAARTLAGQ
ncbi:MAG: heme-binding protein [Alphaproteobacteria bacterium]|nr:heme-binding protein [Alphaproteobacteria bacterium]